MMIDARDSAINEKRREVPLPGRLRLHAHRGVTLVELMISALILTIVSIAWLEIIGIQSARKEARRREAVERLAGMMDAFMLEKKTNVMIGSYELAINDDTLTVTRDGDTNTVHRVFADGISPIGYQLCVVSYANLPERRRFSGWSSSHKWLIGRLYNLNGSVKEAGRPFFTLPVCLGM